MILLAWTAIAVWCLLMVYVLRTAIADKKDTPWVNTLAYLFVLLLFSPMVLFPVLWLCVFGGAR